MSGESGPLAWSEGRMYAVQSGPGSAPENIVLSPGLDVLVWPERVWTERWGSDRVRDSVVVVMEHNEEEEHNEHNEHNEHRRRIERSARMPVDEGWRVEGNWFLERRGVDVSSVVTLSSLSSLYDVTLCQSAEQPVVPVPWCQCQCQVPTVVPVRRASCDRLRGPSQSERHSSQWHGATRETQQPVAR